MPSVCARFEPTWYLMKHVLIIHQAWQLQQHKLYLIATCTLGMLIYETNNMLECKTDN